MEEINYCTYIPTNSNEYTRALKGIYLKLFRFEGVILSNSDIQYILAVYGKIIKGVFNKFVYL